MKLPFSLPSSISNLGIVSFVRSHIMVIFSVFWFVVVASGIFFIYSQIKQQLSEPLPVSQAAEFRLEKLNNDFLKSKKFLNLRTLATVPTKNEYTKCLGVPGRPHIFTPFVPCQ